MKLIKIKGLTDIQSGKLGQARINVALAYALGAISLYLIGRTSGRLQSTKTGLVTWTAADKAEISQQLAESLKKIIIENT